MSLGRRGWRVVLSFEDLVGPFLPFHVDRMITTRATKRSLQCARAASTTSFSGEAVGTRATLPALSLRR
jgi:hypothetical protein